MKEKKWYQKVSNWLFILVLIIFLPVLAINLYITIQANTNQDKVPDVFGYKPFIVLSGSMETKIHVGDLIMTKIVEPETLNKDDVIAFRDAENTVTTHRIIDIVEKNGETYFVTKGDNNDSQDQNLVEYKDVEGIYLFRIPGVGTMLNELAKPQTAVIVVLGITIIFVLAFQISNKKLKSQEEAEFLEYKKMKEQEKLDEKKNNSNKKVSNDDKKEVSKTSKESAQKKTPGKKSTSNKNDVEKSTSAKKSTTTKKSASTKNTSKKSTTTKKKTTKK